MKKGESSDSGKLIKAWQNHQIWTRWVALRNKLKKDGYHTAGLFKGYIPDGFARNPNEGILYVGKATAGPFEGKDAHQDAFGKNKKAFWKFARRLNGLCGGDAKSDKPDRVAWSNCCRIGDARARRNPTGRLYEEQEELAAETLRFEWEHLKPRLVVCAVEGNFEEIVEKAVGAKWADWKKVALAGDTFYYLTESGLRPKFLLLKHPQMKKTVYLDAAFAVAQQLFEGKDPAGPRRTG